VHLVVRGDLTNTPPQQVTPEVMSSELSVGKWWTGSYMSSPASDLESFYYTARWAAAFNEGASGEMYNGDAIREYRKMLLEQRIVADIVIQESDYSYWEKNREVYGPFFVRSMALLQPWSKKLRNLSIAWRSVMRQTRDLSDAEEEEYLAYNFLVYAYRGVREYFEILYQHRALLQETV
jgi:hypothetical protein